MQRHDPHGRGIGIEDGERGHGQKFFVHGGLMGVQAVSGTSMDGLSLGAYKADRVCERSARSIQTVRRVVRCRGPVDVGSAMRSYQHAFGASTIFK